MAIHGTRATAGRRRLRVLGSTSFDAKTRTFTTSATSQTPCPAYRTRPGKDGHDEMFEVAEVLLAEGCANLDEAAGLPFVDSHDYSSIGKRLGVITAARVEGENVVVEVELDGRASVREHDADFASGKLPFVSAGYQPLTEREPRENPDGGPPIVEVTSWRLLEVSSVLVPADSTVGIRSKDMTKPAATDAHDEEKISVGAMRSFLATLGLGGTRAKRDDDMGDDEARKRSKREEGEGDGDEDKETADERAARLKARKAKRDAEDDDKRAKREADESDDSKVSEDERKKREVIRTSLRTVAERNGRSYEFDVLVKAGASIAELRSAVAGGMATPPAERREAMSLPTGDAPVLVSLGQSIVAQRAAKNMGRR